MKTEFTVTINGKEYPCKPTMGAMLRFKEQTGREVTQITADSLSDVCVYLYCCIVSASKREGVEFNMSLMDFADSVTTADIDAWQSAISDDAPDTLSAEDEKKSKGGY